MTTATATPTLSVECERCGQVLPAPTEWIFEGRTVTCADLARDCATAARDQLDQWAPAEPDWTSVGSLGVRIQRPTTRVCRLCGEEFTPRGNEHYCCPSHRKLAAQFRMSHVEIRRCWWCRTEFVWVKRDRTTGRYCSSVCHYRRRSTLARKPRGKSRAPQPRRPCDMCGAWMVPARQARGARYCSRRCAAASQRLYSASHIADGPPLSIRVAVERLHAAGINTCQQTLIGWLQARVLRGEHGHGRRSVSAAALDDLIHDIQTNPLSYRNQEPIDA